MKKVKKPKTFEDGVDLVLAELKSMMLRKQADYGPKNITDFGALGCLVNANSKVNRLRNLLMNNKTPNNESIDDSWVDLANYAIIALMLRKKVFELPL